MSDIPASSLCISTQCLTFNLLPSKSTVMRSTAAAALLISSGLCAPVQNRSFIRQMSSLFVRPASADIPMENKSAFGAEMGDVASLLLWFVLVLFGVVVVRSFATELPPLDREVK